MWRFFFICLTLNGALFAEAAYVQLSSLATQTPSARMGSLVKMETVGEIKNFTVAPTKDRITATQDGLYFVIVTGQVGATDPGIAGYVDCWFEKNGKPILNSSSRQTIDASNPLDLVTTEFLIRLSAGDTLGTRFTASGPSLGFIYIKPDNEPAIPSVTLSSFKIE